jgi:hypothetical protein
MRINMKVELRREILTTSSSNSESWRVSYCYKYFRPDLDRLIEFSVFEKDIDEYLSVATCSFGELI